MKETDTFRDAYRRMSDHELIKLATDEWNTLLPAARPLLLAEIQERNLTINEDSSLIVNQQPSINYNLVDKHILQYITEQKIKGESDAFITGGLLERGLEEESINLLLQQFPNYVNSRKEKMNRMMMTSTLQWVSGIALLQLPLNRENHLAIIIIAYALLLLGILRFQHGFAGRRKLNVVEKNYPPMNNF